MDDSKTSLGSFLVGLHWIEDAFAVEVEHSSMLTLSMAADLVWKLGLSLQRPSDDLADSFSR